MLNIVFVCHGNICRSPAAEYIMKSLSDNFNVISRATSFEEIGNDIYPPMKKVLKENGYSFSHHYAQRINQKDFNEADYIFYMDDENYRALHYLFGESEKIKPINIFTPSVKEIEDPWYTNRYIFVLKQIEKCVNDIIKNLN